MWLLPKPYPDEAVGSILLRAQQIHGFALKSLLARLYPRGSVRSSHSFHLAAEVPQLAQRCGMNAQEFLYKHTAFPYATACLPSGYAEELEERYLNCNGR